MPSVTSGARPQACCGSCTSGSASHDQAGADGDRRFPDSVRHLCAVPVCHALGGDGAVIVADPDGGAAGTGIASAGRHQFHPAGAFFRRAAGLDLHPRAYGERQVRSRSREMSAAVLDGASWLTTGATAHVLKLLNGDGEEARVVGGAVRNALMKLPVGEVDIATTAVPDEVIRRAKAAGIKSVPTGIDHGTVTLVIDSRPFEVTTLREDTETFGRHAKVSFGRDWIGDANRRDFTINALSVGPDGVVHDYVGGLADIAARRVRF